MRRWKPQPTIHRWIALGLLLALLAVATWLGLQIAARLQGPPEQWQVDLGLFGLVLALVAALLAAGACAYRAAAALTLCYEVDRNALYIIWLGNRAVVPLDQVQSIDLGAAPIRMPWRVFQGIGYFWGQAEGSYDRRLHLFSSVPPAQSLVVYLPDEAYVIAPADRDGFVQDLEQRRNLGATKPLAAAIEPSRIFLYEFWNDATVRTLLLVALTLNLVVLGMLAARYPQLAPMVQMRFDAAGQVSDLRPRHQALFLPLAAFALSLLNIVVGLLFYRRQPVGVRLLQGASVVVQILFGIAVLTIIR